MEEFSKPKRRKTEPREPELGRKVASKGSPGSGAREERRRALTSNQQDVKMQEGYQRQHSNNGGQTKMKKILTAVLLATVNAVANNSYQYMPKAIQEHTLIKDKKYLDVTPLTDAQIDGLITTKIQLNKQDKAAFDKFVESFNIMAKQWFEPKKIEIYAPEELTTQNALSLRKILLKLQANVRVVEETKTKANASGSGQSLQTTTYETPTTLKQIKNDATKPDLDTAFQCIGPDRGVKFILTTKTANQVNVGCATTVNHGYRVATAKQVQSQDGKSMMQFKNLVRGMNLFFFW